MLTRNEFLTWRKHISVLTLNGPNNCGIGWHARSHTLPFQLFAEVLPLLRREAREFLKYLFERWRHRSVSIIVLRARRIYGESLP